MQSLVIAANETLDRLQELNDEARLSGCQYAENEAEYRKALRLEILAARNNGMPVSIISDICRGIPYVADLKFKRDCSEAVYKASQEAININKLRLRTINDQIAREYACSPR